MIKEAIARLVDGRTLSGDEARGALDEIMRGEATPAQIAAFITALRIRGETPEIIAGCARALREHFTPVPAHAPIIVDTCGTGGDGAGTFNISTTAAFVAAGAGVTVAKHGNRGVSSRCGSADVLAELGVELNLPPAALGRCLDEIGIAFLFAPNLHPAMRFAIGPRREIGIRTIFNILGPLANPAGAARGVLGVFAADWVPRLAEAAAELGARHLYVVHGLDGMDEISLSAPTRVGIVRDGRVEVTEWLPEMFGLSRCRREELAGGDAAENATILRKILEGERGPRRDIAVINAAAAILAGGAASSPREAAALAAHAIDSGAALAKMQTLVQRTRELARAQTG